MKKTLVYVVALISVGAFAIYQRVASKAPVTTQEVATGEQSPEAQGNDSSKPRPQLAQSVRLPDGSLNPNDPNKSFPGESPQELLAQDDWRERYRPHLEELQVARTGPSIYVYPFLDATVDGVGPYFTYAWGSFGAAVLAYWTNARPAPYVAPSQSGIPRPDQLEVDGRPSFEAWKEIALSDPASQSADYVITGVYESVEATGPHTLRIELLDWTAGVVGKTLVEDVLEERGSFSDFSRQQRLVGRKLARELDRLGVVGPAPTISSSTLDLTRELSQVVRLINAHDSWATMEAIDRSLQLSLFFPGETLPLQAAAYALNVLTHMAFYYGISTEAIDRDYVYRSFALSQLALRINPTPVMTELNWLYTTAFRGDTYDRLRTATWGTDRTDQYPELSGYKVAIEREPMRLFEAHKLEAYPHWQVLNLEELQTWFVWHSDYRPHVEQLEAHWEEHDFFVQTHLLTRTNKNYFGRRTDFARYLRGASVATRATFAAESAAIISTLKDRPESNTLRRVIAESGDFSVDVARLDEPGAYYRVRRSVIDALSKWQEPRAMQTASFELLKAMRDAAEVVHVDTNLTLASTGFSGIEFTSSERVRFFQRRDHLGPDLLARFNASMHGVYDPFLRDMQAYTVIRPNQLGGQISFLDRLNQYRSRPDALKKYKELLQTITRIHPLAYIFYYEMGEDYFRRGVHQIGKTYLEAYRKSDPFKRSARGRIGDLYRKYGYHRLAVEHLTAFVEESPEAYNHSLHRAWSLCEMGGWERPELREIFAAPAKALPGNGFFHEENLKYLYYWLGDLEEAKKYAEVFDQIKNYRQSKVWRARIEREMGNVDAAMDILQEITFDGLSGLELASNYVSLGNTYLELDRIDLAEQYIRKGAAIDHWHGGVILGLANLAFAKKDYATAASEYTRYIDRYGDSWAPVRGLAKCYLEGGEPDKAIALLEKHVFKGDSQGIGIYFVADLINLYANAERPVRAREALDNLLDSGLRTRGRISDALKAYERIDQDEASEIKGRLNEIMAGPDL